VAHIVLPFVKPDWELLRTWIPADDPAPLFGEDAGALASMQMAVLAGYARSLGRDQILMGDFNNTPWSDVQVGFPLRRPSSTIAGRWSTTWPAQLPAPLRVPIDFRLRRRAGSPCATSMPVPISARDQFAADRRDRLEERDCRGGVVAPTGFRARFRSTCRAPATTPPQSS